jgi:hypothetical protein
MKLRAFCQQGHDRIEMYHDPSILTSYCQECKFEVTDETLHYAIPEQYRPLAGQGFGAIAASLMDVGGFNIVYDNVFMPKIEWLREDQV